MSFEDGPLEREWAPTKEEWDAMDDLDAKHSELVRLREYVEADCRCPCCCETRVCLEGCTFQADAPDAWERMQAARKAMWGDD